MIYVRAAFSVELHVYEKYIPNDGYMVKGSKSNHALCFCCFVESSVVKVITQMTLGRFELHKPLFNSRGYEHLCVSEATMVHSARGSLSVTQSLQSALA